MRANYKRQEEECVSVTTDTSSHVLHHVDHVGCREYLCSSASPHVSIPTRIITPNPHHGAPCVKYVEGSVRPVYLYRRRKKREG